MKFLLSSKKKDKKVLKVILINKGNKDVRFLPEKKKLFVKTGKTAEDLRLAGGNIAKILENENFKAIEIQTKKGLKYLIEGLILRSYKFIKYKSDAKKFPVKTVYLQTLKGVQEAKIIAESTNFVKEIVNSIPNDVYPKTMAKIAKKLAKDNNLEFSSLNMKQLIKEGMSAFVAVGRASVNPPMLVKIAYRPKKAKKKILLIGKGLTYDSGGLSLKPASYMETMKSDKSGASAVLGILKAVSELKLNVEVVGYLGLAENLVSGNSYKPDDILIAKNGKTIEVRNTDAEGRLVLADTLVYAQDDEVEFDYIFDIATLTGAAIVAVGQYTTLAMGHNNKLKQKILKAGDKSGELVATLPFNQYLRKTIDSRIADISNTGSSRYGGSLTAGLFLSEFIAKKNQNKWIHLDIAGPAYIESDWGYHQFGGSGASVRMITKFIQDLEK
jgi:leucyl aminopeptidase